MKDGGWTCLACQDGKEREFRRAYAHEITATHRTNIEHQIRIQKQREQLDTSTTAIPEQHTSEASDVDLPVSLQGLIALRDHLYAGGDVEAIEHAQVEAPRTGRIIDPRSANRLNSMFEEWAEIVNDPSWDEGSTSQVQSDPERIAEHIANILSGGPIVFDDSESEGDEEDERTDAESEDDEDNNVGDGGYFDTNNVLSEYFRIVTYKICLNDDSMN